MAASGARALKPVGSATWISSEKENIMNLVNQEMEEVEFPVRNEMDWLNEHMAEIFSKNQLSVDSPLCCSVAMFTYICADHVAAISPMPSRPPASFVGRRRGRRGSAM